jgi:two-component sensor histidine kinase
MQKAAATGKAVPRSECEIRFADGESVFIAGHSVPMFNEKGQVCGSLGAYVDVTEIKRLEHRNRLLSGELSHRVRNIVATIHSISNQTLRGLLEPGDYQAYERRLLAIGNAHELLFERHSSRMSLDAIITAALSPIVGKELERVTLRGPSVGLHQDGAVSIIMIFHELGTNAAKYGALRGPRGLVSCEWKVDGTAGEELVQVEWRESGGPAVQKPTRSGFGTKMMAFAARGIRGARVKVDYDPSGLRCRITLPCCPLFT